MSDTIRIGVAGLNWGTQHLSAFAQVEGATITAIADTDANRLRAAAKDFPGAQAFESANELIESGAVDAVVIATPTYLHERQSNHAFDAGLHVLCESPVGINGREASHLLTASGLTGRVFMWSNPLRFDPRVAAAQGAVAEGSVGEVFHAVATCRIPGWKHAADAWQLDRDRGGGALLAVAVQTIDAVWYAMGCPDPMEALGARFDRFAQNHASGLDAIAEDTMTGMIRFKNGSTLQCVAQINHPSATGSIESEQRLWGVDGALDLVLGQLTDLAGKTRPLAEPPFDSSQGFTAQAAAFLEAVRSHSEPPTTGKQALSLAKMTDALATSAKEKEAVSIKVERSLDDLFGAL